MLVKVIGFLCLQLFGISKQPQVTYDKDCHVSAIEAFNEFKEFTDVKEKFVLVRNFRMKSLKCLGFSFCKQTICNGCDKHNLSILLRLFN